MKSELRFQLAGRGPCGRGEHVYRLRRLPNRAAIACKPGKLCFDIGYGRTIGGHVYRTRQGAHSPALHELPSRNRSAAARRRGPAAPAAGHARRGRSWPSGDALLDLPPACELRARPHAGPSGMAPRAARNGVGRQDGCRNLRAAQGSRTQRRAQARGTHPSYRRRYAGWLGLGSRRRPQPRPGTQKQAGALVEAWVKAGAACPAQ